MTNEYIIFQWGAIAVVLGIGVILAVLRPYWAFLLAILVSISISFTTATFTRTEEFGSYFNLYDACLAIALLAFFADRERKIKIPGPALGILLVLLLGLVNSMFTLGLGYQVLRGVRWAINVPIMFVLAASMVRGEARVRSLLLTLIMGTVLAESQHVLYVLSQGEVAGQDASLRTVQFTLAGSDIWLCAGPFLAGGQIPHPWLQSALGILFLLANVSHQTRSIALAFIGGSLGYYFWFLNGPNSFKWKRFKLLLRVLVIGALITSISGLAMLASGYGERLMHTVTGKKTGDADLGTRERAFRIEINDWLNGNPLIGRGLYYFQIHGAGIKASAQSVAWGHLGYVSYLSQLGLIGFLVYAVWFPLAVLGRARRLIQRTDLSPVMLHLAALTGVCFMVQAILFLFSGSYLQIMFLPGLLAGAVWAVPREI